MKTALLFRRGLAAASALAVGLTGAFAVAAPAGAQYVTEAYVAGVAECADETPGQWLATWTVSSAQLTVRFPDQYQITEVSVSPAELAPPDLPIGEDRDLEEEFVAEQWLPLDVESVQLTATVRWNNQITRTVDETVTRPDGCREDDDDDGGPGNGDDNGDDPGEVEVPVDTVSQCDSLAVTVTNPFPHDSLEATFTSENGTETLTIEVGQSATASFEAGTTVTLTVGDESQEIAWQDPGDCDGDQGDDGGAGGEDELPITGSTTALIAGGAVLLLTLGATLFLLARRRRLTFTA
ncbi:hypothetical protein JQS43_18510 [Natronosporangium hydrolyticum]|uniref:LPXTG cell wall anchor domain-containing protein n=1 Tax=Natronosporangium hydrolyticum TaxID=2811111 RepID=A0A895YG97_9ACTN|nr:hypothetical protein [Natronosporangium hydrolyticum]QSB13566.1 hypothetical protein JQS43_18510 [Natronosporangium hydrolyticum]